MGIMSILPAIEILLRAKGLDTVLLVSDGIAATGMRDGNYRLGNFEVSVTDGVVRNSEGKLAGSTLTLDRALQHIVALGVPLLDAVRMVTLLPARRLGLGGQERRYRRGRGRRYRDSESGLADRGSDDSRRGPRSLERS